MTLKIDDAYIIYAYVHIYV